MRTGACAPGRSQQGRRVARREPHCGATRGAGRKRHSLRVEWRLSMKRAFQSIAAIVVFAAAAQTAFAADLPRRPPPDYPTKAPPLRAFDWTGFYVGVNGGYGWGKSRYDFGAAGINRFNVNGGLVGGTIGYNYQFGQTVLGIEGDIDWADINGSAA